MEIRTSISGKAMALEWKDPSIFALVFSLSFTKSYKEIPTWIFYTELGILILTTIPTEVALGRKFDKEGSLR